MNPEDILYLLEERAAIEAENGATEAERLKSIQSERKRLVNVLRADMGLLNANIEIARLEEIANVYDIKY